MTDFEDIKITGFNDKASKPSGRGALMNMVLELSADAPGRWYTTFNTAWKNHFNMNKRNAHAASATITVTCMPDELQAQIDQLKDVISKVNEAYKKALADNFAAKQKADADAKAKADALSDLKGTLKF